MMDQHAMQIAGLAVGAANLGLGVGGRNIFITVFGAALTTWFICRLAGVV